MAKQKRPVPRARPAPSDPLARIAPWAVAAIVLAVFGASVGHDFVTWDDNIFITDNPYFRGFSWSHLRWMFTTSLFTNSNYIPLTWVTYGADYLFWGLDPRGYHLTSVLLHVATAVSFYLVLLELLPRVFPAAEPVALALGAMVGSLFFAIHPLRVESVAWASARKDVLSGLFYVLTLYTYLRAARAGRRRGRWLAAALALFVLSLAAKSWGTTLPVVLLALDAYPLARLPGTAAERRWALLEKIPFFVLAAIDTAVAIYGSTVVRLVHPLADHPLSARLLQSTYGFWFYIVKTLVPTSLSPLYPLRLGTEFSDPSYALSAIGVVVLLAVAIIVGRRRIWVLCVLAAYVFSILPFLGFLQTGPQLVADRYAYLPSLPLSASIAALVCWLSLEKRWRAGVAAAAFAWLALLGILAFRQTLVWRDTETLWTHALAMDPHSSIAYTNRAWDRQQRGDFDGALADLDQAVASDPSDAAAYNSRGSVRWRLGDADGAEDDFRRGLQVAKPTTRWYGYLQTNLANLQEARRQAGAASASE